MLNELENNPDFLDNVVTGDESWTFQYDPETKAQSSEWHTPASPRPKKARMLKSRVKTMLIVVFDKRGLIHKEFVPQGKTVNAEFYKEVLRRLHKAVKRKRQDLAQRWRLHHDNAPAHTTFLVTSNLSQIGVEVLPQPPYSPDMSPPDFFLFPKINKETRLSICKDVIETVNNDYDSFKTIKTGDETWCSLFNPQTKKQSLEWHTPSSPRKKKIRLDKSKGKAYREIPVRLPDAIRRKGNQLFKSKQWKLLHDNAPTHRDIIVQDYLAKHSVSVLPHPPYSPDIAPYDFFFFSKLK
ncbi:hypothetical protein LAZ67_2000755 [Cordylochernes scorpioides]|uniref:Transposase n=1 Tax=Cordylochernes scorpioides TaxID=51811 RepID=A0ABY6K1P1_9ARAC|nr:hypothetical protein LAZ67_2000755 [Cordylochernes scorpioides]